MSKLNKLSSLNTAILDMDGTLLDLAFDDHLWNRALPERVGARQGLAPEDALAHVKATLDAARGSLAWYCFDHWTSRFEIDIAALERELRSRIRYLDGAEAFLEQLRERSLHVVLATNAHPASVALKHEMTGLHGYFDAVYSSHQFGVAKEDPAFWHRLFEAQRIEPASAFVVDDNEAVLAAAHTAGIGLAITITAPASNQPPRHSDHPVAVPSVGELLQWFER